jgi:hypothetical protein
MARSWTPRGRERQKESSAFLSTTIIDKGLREEDSGPPKPGLSTSYTPILSAVDGDSIGPDIGKHLVMAFDLVIVLMTNLASFTPCCLCRFRLGLGRRRIFLCIYDNLGIRIIPTSASPSISMPLPSVRTSTVQTASPHRRPRKVRGHDHEQFVWQHLKCGGYTCSVKRDDACHGQVIGRMNGTTIMETITAMTMAVEVCT